MITKSLTVRITSTIFTLLILCAAQIGVLHAQDNGPCNGLPYNPDADCDGVITTFDFLSFAVVFGEEFAADFNTLSLPDSLDPDPTNELQWLAIDGDTLHLLLADSTIYSSVYIGGADGAAGMDGADGADGLSAYDLWLEAGNTGSIEDFLTSLIGAAGEDGMDGAAGADGMNGSDGVDGTNGADGADGADGLSAYEIWNAEGNTGSESEFLASLVGPQGPAGENGVDGANGMDGADGADGTNGMDGVDGATGMSAFEIWLAQGNIGTEADFLNSLIGADGQAGADGADGANGANGMDGADGTDGLSAVEAGLAHGNTGTEDDFFASVTGPEGPQGPGGQDGADGTNGIDGTNGTDGADGADGLSAYDIWLAAGNTGSEADFLASLVGQDGADGANGADGADGADGANGADGMNGLDGLNGADGADGLSAFEIWLAAGNTGNESDFLASLVGAPGAQGEDGLQGPEGPQGPQGVAGADGAEGAAGLSAYEIWLGLGNSGTEEDFIAYLSGGAAFSPSVHGVFDSESDGNTFEIAEAIATVSIELWGASGGSGGDICGQTLGASSCNLCDATGGIGGRALKVVSMVYNLAQGDVLTLVPSDAGAESGELITCNPGLTGWTNWDCGPASSGADGGTTQLLLNGEVIAEISGGMGGTGACIGCQGDGCFNGDPGTDGTLSGSANWMTVLSTETLEENTGSRVIFRY